MGLTYCSAQQSDEEIKLVMVHLGITQGTPNDSSDDNTVMNTERILSELSEVQRNLAEEQPKTGKGTTKKKGDEQTSKVRKRERERQGKSTNTRKSFSHTEHGIKSASQQRARPRHSN